MFEKIVLRFSQMATSPILGVRLRGIVLIFLFFFLPPLLLAAYSFMKVDKILTENTLSRRQAVAIPTALALQEQLDGVVDLGISISIHPKIHEYIYKQNWREAVLAAQVFQDLSSQKFVDRIFISDAEGTVRAAEPELTGGVGNNFNYRDWYKGVMATGKPYVSEVYQRQAEPKYNVVAVAVPIVGEDQQIHAISVLQIHVERFAEWLKTVWSTEQKGFVYVVDPKGQVVSHPKYKAQDAIVDYSSVPVVQRVLQDKRGVEVLYNPIEQEWRVSAYEPVPHWGWGVIVQEPVDQAFAFRRSSHLVELFVYGLIFIFYACVAAGLVKVLARAQNKQI